MHSHDEFSRGFQATDVISKLYAAHQEGGATAGFDVEGDASAPVRDAVEANIVDLYLTKHWALKFATAAANTILKVDQVGDN